MKKLIITSLLAASITYVSFAFAKDWDAYDSNKTADWTSGHHRFTAALNLDTDRAAKLDVILDSYREVPKLYFTNQGDKIPAFLAQKEVELETLLTPEELAQFKQSFGEWAKKKNFNFMKFSSYQPKSLHQRRESVLPDALYLEINQNIDNQLLELRKRLDQQSLHG